jgi:hypothetical protein
LALMDHGNQAPRHPTVKGLDDLPRAQVQHRELLA